MTNAKPVLAARLRQSRGLLCESRRLEAAIFHVTDGGRENARAARAPASAEMSGQQQQSQAQQQLAGHIFGCTGDTLDECLGRKLFGLPAAEWDTVRHIRYSSWHAARCPEIRLTGACVLSPGLPQARLPSLALQLQHPGACQAVRASTCAAELPGCLT